MFLRREGLLCADEPPFLAMYPIVIMDSSAESDFKKPI